MKNIVTITPFGLLFGSTVSTIKSDDMNYSIKIQSKNNATSEFNGIVNENYKMKHLNDRNKCRNSLALELDEDSAINQNWLFVFLARI